MKDGSTQRGGLLWTDTLPPNVPSFYRGENGSGRIRKDDTWTDIIQKLRENAEDFQMAKDKQQKKKERERRVAQKKLTAAAKKQAQEKSTKEAQKAAPKKPQVMSGAVTKTDYVPTTNKKSTFTQRRGGG